MNKKTKIIHKEIFFYNGKDFSNLHRPPLFLINREINCRWCGREDSNFHGLPHSDLNAARLPIPPRPHVVKQNILAFSL